MDGREPRKTESGEKPGTNWPTQPHFREGMKNSYETNTIGLRGGQRGPPFGPAVDQNESTKENLGYPDIKNLST
ncbi:hypothetical protein KAR91_68920 [Candidatus Pacearchaeota archaeon]|nr:hypothetical protein [Candidatus Pacearchaeota archaeon]